jgi:hypothetical protein
MATRRISFISVTTLGLLTLLASCESATLGGGPAIVISATWTDTNDEFHLVDFRSADDGHDRGLIAGHEEHDDCFDVCPLGGYWENGRIHITIKRDSDQHKFVADFTHANPTELTFTSTTGADGFTIRQ